MTKFQWTIIGVFALLFVVLFFGFSTQSPVQKAAGTSRAIQGEATGFETLLDAAKAAISNPQSEALQSLESALEKATDNASKSDALKKLSGFWYQNNQIAVAGYYAEQVAETENSAEAWSVAGGTYYNGVLASAGDPAIRAFCAGRAVKAFESAASLAPQQVEHRVNLALVYAENPPADNPMKPVLMLRELEAQHPNEPSVYNALGRLAIKTGQWEKAIERLNKALELDKSNPNTPCLLAKAWEGLGNADKANEFAQLCNSANSPK